MREHSTGLKIAVLVGVIAAAALSVASLFVDGISDGVISLLLAVMFITWFRGELRRDPARTDRRIIVAGLVCGGLLIVGGMMNLAGV